MVKRMSKNRLHIDETKCRKCGICVTACPAKVFEKRKETISICYDKLDFCINCKDCISVCPSGAITNQDFDLEKLPVNDIPYDIEKLLCNLKNRRTIRKYKNRSLTEEEMKYIGEVASLAPRGGHTEGVRNTGIIIVKDINVIKKIRNYSYDYICVLRKKLTSPILKISTIFNKSLNKSINSTVERIDLVLKLKQHDIDMITYDAPNLIITLDGNVTAPESQNDQPNLYQTRDNPPVGDDNSTIVIAPYDNAGGSEQNSLIATQTTSDISVIVAGCAGVIVAVAVVAVLLFVRRRKTK
jgi:ferredoxin